MFTHLVIPLDGSPMSEAVLPAAARLAQGAGARASLLHVLEREPPRTVHGAPHLARNEEAEAYLRDVAARSFPAGTPVDWHVRPQRTRHVAASLVAMATELGADLVVMCSHGPVRVRDRLVGNLAQQAAGERAVPVLLLQPAADGRVRFPFDRVLVTLDGQAEHEEALAPAADVARLCQAPVLLVMVVRTMASLSPEQTVTGQLLPGTTRELLELREQQAAAYLAAHIERLQQEGICASGRVARGRPARLITASARETQAQLIAIGTHGTSGTRAFWAGSLTPRLIRQAGTSILLAPVPCRTGRCGIDS